MGIVQQQFKGRLRRHRRVRKRVSGAVTRPRLCVFRSNRYLYVQLIDDDGGRTLAAANTAESELTLENGSRHTVAAAKALGKLIGARAKAAGISQVVFDRGGYIYHGRIRAVAEGAREAGLEF